MLEQFDTRNTVEKSSISDSVTKLIRGTNVAVDVTSNDIKTYQSNKIVT